MIRRIDLFRPIFRRRAFTLVELMVAIALVLILLIGINQVFKMTTDTVGAGQALNAASRDLRGAQSVFFNDLHGAVTANPPAFIIRSEQTTAFRNRADELGDRDYAAAAATATASVSAANTNAMEEKIRTIDLDNNGAEGETTVPGEVISPALYGDRSHRTDKLLFFARGYFPRQTGNDGTFAADMSSNEAYIWYGQLKLPNNSDPNVPSSYRGLGADFPTALSPPLQAPWTTTTNPNNFYASQWVLGREVIGLREPVGGMIGDNSTPPIAQYYIGRDPSPPPPGNKPPLSPLSVNSRATVDLSTFNPNILLQYSRYDLAGTSIDGYRTIVTSHIDSPAAGDPWWYTLSYWRFQASQYYMRPLNSYGVARTVPLFLNNCSQFIVEYAGDFLTQDNTPSSPNYSRVTAWGPDGKVDYLVVNGVNRTRWYGMPRNVDTSDDVGGAVILGSTSDTNQLIDVVPLRDVLLAASITPPTLYFERYVPPNRPNYADPANGLAPLEQYVAAWGPDTAGQPLPKMIRIVATVDDPAGRMANPQTMDYVIDLP